MINDDINRYLGVFSYPFVSLDFLHKDTLNEYLSLVGVEESLEQHKKIKKELREKTIYYVRNKYGLYSYDEVYLFLEKWYLYPRIDSAYELQKSNSCDVILGHLRNFSKSFISQLDGKIVYKYWENKYDKDLLGGFCGSNKIYLFHSINRLFPLDILTSIYLVENGKSIDDLEDYYGNIEIADAQLSQVLKQGVAENHLHKGVSGSFVTIWENMMKPVTYQNYNAFSSLDFNNTYNLGKEQLLYYLFLAGIIRARLALMLQCDLDIEDTDEKGKKEHPYIVDAKKIASIINHCEVETQRENLISNNYSADLAEWVMEQWNDILGDVNNIEEDKNSLMKSIFSDVKTITTTDENIFLYKILLALKMLNNRESENVRLIKLLFLNYLRIKNFFYGLLVQPKTVHGLNHFQDLFYNNNSTGNKFAVKSLHQNHWEMAIREQLQNEYLEKLELRISVKGNEDSFYKSIIEFLRSYQKVLHENYCRPVFNIATQKEEYVPIKKLPRVGIVVHLIKREQDFFPQKCLVRVDDENEFLQYGKLYQSYVSQIEVLKKVRQKYIALDKYIVGLDVASLENAVPTWVFTSIYEKARDSSCDPLAKYQSLGFTIHAGEDFRHILSGLRRIYEAIVCLKFHSGDRIGHGIALGISPKEWHRSNATIIIPRVEALENYLWAYKLLSNSPTMDTFVNVSYLEKQIYKLAREIYGNQHLFTTNLLIDTYDTLYTSHSIFDDIKSQGCLSCNKSNTSPSCLLAKHKRFGSFDENMHESRPWTVNELITTMHCQYFVYKMNEPIHIKVTEQDINISIQMQKIVKDFMNQKGIVVEINPTSNVSIADVDTLSQNQIYNINNCHYNFDNIIACVNSDDPSVFNTNVSNELGYIYFGMIEKGVNREDILTWIEKLRDNGMKASFIRRNDTDEELLRSLDEFVNNI